MQTGIKRIYTPQQATSTIGGICHWWYVPLHLVARFPLINTFTQQYEEEPQLVPGAEWIGPVKVPDSKRGWEESQETAKPGFWMKQKVVGYLPGETKGNRILLQNMPFQQYIIVAQIRSSGDFAMIGNQHSGLSFDHGFKTGNGGNKSDVGSELAFAGELPYKAPTLRSFSAFLRNITLNATLVFSTQLQPFIPNVTGTARALNNLLKVRFQIIPFPIGFPATMRIWLGYEEILVLNFNEAYIGMPLEITDTAGIVHLTSFQPITLHL